jgi:hypothetical protein
MLSLTRPFLAGLNQGVLLVGMVWQFVGLKNDQFAPARNQGGMTFEDLIRQLAQGALGLAQIARLHAD